MPLRVDSATEDCFRALSRMGSITSPKSRGIMTARHSPVERAETGSNRRLDDVNTQQNNIKSYF